MKRTEWLQETRKMRFEEAYGGWQGKRLTQEEAARILGVSDRTFRRYAGRYEDSGLEGLVDKRLSQDSHRRAPVDEVLSLQEMYRQDHSDWNAKHFHSWYKRHGGRRSYTWVKTRLQEARLIPKRSKKGVHRKRRDRAALPGMMIHQDASSHEWVPGQKWDMVVTMDDATSWHYSMFFCAEEGTQSSFKGARETIEAHGLFCTFYSDRGSHYWHTPVAGGKVDKVNLTQFGRALKQLGITMIPAYSPEARGRSERMFETHQGRLPNELALMEITTMEEANRYLREHYLPEFNKEFARPAREEGTAFIKYIGPSINEILCEHYDRTVGHDNCVSFETLSLQIPSDQYRCNYIKATVRVHRYLDGTMAIFHGPRKLAMYDCQGKQSVMQVPKKAA
jgi:transposase